MTRRAGPPGPPRLDSKGTPLSSQAGSEDLFDLLGLGEAPIRLLGVDQLAVPFDLEDPVAPFDELGFDAELISNRVRQTGGSGQVVSNDAVFNGKIVSHQRPPRFNAIEGALYARPEGFVPRPGTGAYRAPAAG